MSTGRVALTPTQISRIACENRMLSEGACVDHIAIANRNMTAIETLFRCMGFQESGYSPHPRDIDQGETSMWTKVIGATGIPKNPSAVQFAVMEGIDRGDMKDQISEYPDFFVQHIAIRYEGDIFRLADNWRELGIRFITEHEGHDSPFLKDEYDGNKIVQAFTYPVISQNTPDRVSTFFEIKKVLTADEAKRLSRGEEFRDRNVEGLRERVRNMQRTGALFELNIFGEQCPLRESLERRGIPVAPNYPTQMSQVI